MWKEDRIVAKEKWGEGVTEPCECGRCVCTTLYLSAFPYIFWKFPFIDVLCFILSVNKYSLSCLILHSHFHLLSFKNPLRLPSRHPPISLSLGLPACKAWGPSPGQRGHAPRFLQSGLRDAWQALPAVSLPGALAQDGGPSTYCRSCNWGSLLHSAL